MCGCSPVCKSYEPAQVISELAYLQVGTARSVVFQRVAVFPNSSGGRERSKNHLGEVSHGSFGMHGNGETGNACAAAGSAEPVDLDRERIQTSGSHSVISVRRLQPCIHLVDKFKARQNYGYSSFENRDVLLI